MKTLNRAQIDQIAAEYGLDGPVVCAVLEIESSGKGFNSNGDVIIQFEPHWFKRYTGINIPNGVEGQIQEWIAFKKAFAINPDAARLSTSWGLGQIMGFNHKKAGYPDTLSMVKAFYESEANQLRGMLNFIKSIPKMFEALKNREWGIFAYYYNGPKYKDFKYDTRLQSAYDKYNPHAS